MFQKWYIVSKNVCTYYVENSKRKQQQQVMIIIKMIIIMKMITTDLFGQISPDIIIFLIQLITGTFLRTCFYFRKLYRKQVSSARLPVCQNNSEGYINFHDFI